MKEPSALKVAIGGRFRLGRALGAGSSGVVYEAFDERDEVPVALKVMRSRGSEQHARLARELEVLKSIAHPNLLRLGEIFVADGSLCLSMELVTGEDFLAYVRPGGAADERRLRHALVQLATALLALHATGRVHRDLKPSNVLVTPEERAVLLDFGLMSDPEEEEAAASSPGLVGTVTHMAPEQASERSVGPEADWYGLGVMLYQALTGELPFSGVPLQVLVDKQRRDPQPPHARCPGAPRDLSELCAELLRFDPARRPSGYAVLRRLSANGANLATSTHTLVTPLRGREAECEAFEQLLASVRGGASACLSLQGEAGSGKTRLMARLCERARELGATVLQARPGARRPYNVLDPLGEPLSALLRAASAESPPIACGATLKRISIAFEDAPHLDACDDVPDAQELRARMFGAARELFARLAAERLLVVALDDVDIADEDSVALLSTVLREPGAPRLLLLVSHTAPDAPLPFGSPTRLALGRLEGTALRQLAQDLLQGGGRAQQADDIARQSEGSPLLAQELVRVAALDGDPRSVRGYADALSPRASRLSPQALEAARLLALCAAPLRLDVLAQVLNVEPREASRLAALLSLLGFASIASGRDGETLELAHRAFARPLLGEIDSAAQDELRLALCRVLERCHPPETELMAELYVAAGQPGRGATHALAAAERAERALAFHRAAELFETASRVLTPGSTEQRTALTRAGRAAANAGQGVRAAWLYAQARQGANSAEALELGQLAAQQLYYAGEIPEGEQMLRSVLSTAQVSYPATPWRALVLLLFDLLRLTVRGIGFTRRDVTQLPVHVLTRIDAMSQAGMVLVIADSMRGHFFVLRSLLAALRCGEAYRVARGLCIHAGSIAAGGSRTEPRTERLLQSADALMQEIGAPPQGSATVIATRAHARYLAGRFVESHALCERAERMLRDRCTNAAWELNVVRLWGACSLMFLGRYHELHDRLPPSLEECRQRGDLYGEVSLVVGVHSYTLLAAGRPADALRDVRDAQARWRAQGFHVQHYCGLLSRAAIALYEGAPAEAHAHMCEVLGGLSRSLLGHAQVVRIDAHSYAGNAALSLLTAGGDERKLTRAVQKHARVLLGERTGWSIAQGEVLLAGLAVRAGRREAALEHLRRAARSYDAVEMAVYAACVRRKLGELEGGETGARLVAEADRFMAERGVREPARFCAVLVPRF
jgi:hypothetical protein